MAAALASLTVPTWTCTECRVEMIGALPPDAVCHRCRLRRLEARSFSRALNADHVPLEQRASCPRQSVLRACGVPAEYREPFDPRKLPGGVWPRDFRDEQGRNRVDLGAWTAEAPLHTLLLKGHVGQGKTMAGVEIGYRLWLRGHSFAYVMAADLVAAIFERRFAELRRLRRVQALLVDDIDRGPTGAAWHPVFGFLHRHIATQRPLILTQNSPLGKGSGALFEANAALADRLQRGLVVTFTGASQR